MRNKENAFQAIRNKGGCETTAAREDILKSLRLDISHPGVLAGLAGAAAWICGTGRGLMQYSASEAAVLPGTGVGEAATRGKECKCSSH